MWNVWIVSCTFHENKVQCHIIIFQSLLHFACYVQYVYNREEVRTVFMKWTINFKEQNSFNAAMSWTRRKGYILNHLTCDHQLWDHRILQTSAVQFSVVHHNILLMY